MDKNADLANDPALDPEERERQQQEERDEHETKGISGRQTYLVDRDFQYRFATSWVACMVLYAVLVGAIFYGATVYVRGTLQNEVVRQFLSQLLQYAGLPTVLLTLVFAMYFVLLSHRIAGPEYRLNRSLGRVASGEVDFSVELRSTDYLQSIADRLNEVLGVLRDRREKLTDLRNQVEQLRERMSSRDDVSDEDLELCERIRDDLDSLSSPDEKDGGDQGAETSHDG